MSIKRYRFGFITHAANQKYQAEMLSGIVDAAVKYDIDIVRFILELDYTYYRMENQVELLCNIADNLSLDGILYLAWMGSPESKKALFKKSGNIPFVLLGRCDPNYINIYQDGIMCIKYLVHHLLEYHRYKRIVFIEPISPDSRSETYMQIMKEHGVYDRKYVITVDDMQMTGRWDFIERVSRVEEILFEERKLEIDAIMTMYTEEAVLLIERINRRNLRVPDDIAITSWEESEVCRYNDPPITTVYFPFYEMGYAGCEVLAHYLSGIKIENSNVVPSRILLRRSCGCTPSLLEKAAIRKMNKQEKTLLEITDAEKAGFLVKLKEKMDYLEAGELFTAFFQALKNQDVDSFSRWLENIIRSRHVSIAQLYVIQDDILTFRREIKPWLVSSMDLSMSAEELWIKIQIIIGSWIEKTFGIQEKNKTYFTLHTQEISIDLITAFSMEKIRQTLDVNLPKLRIPNCFLYKITADNTGDYIPRMIYDYRDNKALPESRHQDNRFDIDMLFSGKRHTYLLHILHVRDLLLGCAFFEYGIEDDRIYFMLAIELSSALEGAQVVQDLKEANNEIKKRTDALELSNQKLSKLDNLKNDFIANITHDFRSPLMIILNNTDLGLKYDNNNFIEQVHKRYDVIYEAALKLKSSIDQLLELAKMDAQGIKIHVRNIPLKIFLERITDFYQSAVIATRIKIINTAQAANLDIYTDPDLLEEVLNNIISNAMKFIDPEKGEIRIELEDLPQNIRIHIRDNGIGIPPDKLETIFGRFEQVETGRNNRYRGTGIGLAFSRQLIGYLKGRIWAESAGLELGSEFIVELKKGKEHFTPEELVVDAPYYRHYHHEEQKRFEFKRIIETELKNKLDRIAVTKSFKNLNKENEFDPKKGIILIVDDNRFIREIVFEYLEKNGFMNFILAGDGQQGVEAAYQHRPDLIICDYNMPYLRGDQFHDELTGNPDFKKIPFIFLTAVANKDIVLERKQKGAVAYLSKPIEESDLVLTVELHMFKYMELKSSLYQAATDELTGINNKSSLIKWLRSQLSNNKTEDLSVLFFDLDHFKVINDTYGHPAGDTMLHEIGKLIKDTIHFPGMAGRYGGEEFLIALPGTDAEKAFLVAEKIRNCIKERIIIHEDVPIRITASFGISSLARCSQKSPDALIDLADRALYISKSTTCTQCGFHSGKSELFTDNKCPECSSTNLITGRNRTTVLP